MKHVRLFVAALALLMGLGGAAPALVSADTPKTAVCTALQAGFDCTTAPPNGTSINTAIGAVINILSFLVGTVAVIMIIYGGFRYISSGGDSGKITSAKNTIIYAIIGLVVTAFAQVIVRFVLQKIK